MNKLQIEYWALRVIEQVESGQPNEDSSVELKAEWPEVKKAARRIAGHANAARGENILWLIGVDEVRGILGADNSVDLANWYPQVEAQFDGIAPRLLTHFNIPAKDKTVVALLFETDRAPFVVKNPNGGSPEREVPWREGARVRSATRSDLIKLLSPMQKLPKLEALDGAIYTQISYHFSYSDIDSLNWNLKLDIYVSSVSETRVIIPCHKCNTSFEILGIDNIDLEKISLSVPSIQEIYATEDPSFRPDSFNIQSSSTQLIINGSDKIILTGQKKINDPEIIKAYSLANSIKVHVKLMSDVDELPISLSVTFVKLGDGQTQHQWILGHQHPENNV